MTCYNWAYKPANIRGTYISLGRGSVSASSVVSSCRLPERLSTGLQSRLQAQGPYNHVSSGEFVGVDEPAQSLRRFFCVFLLASMHKHKPSKLRCTQPSCAGRRGPILIVRAITILRKACDQIQAIKLELHATGGLMPRAFSACNPYTRSAAGPRLQRDHSGK